MLLSQKAFHRNERGIESLSQLFLTQNSTARTVPGEQLVTPNANSQWNSDAAERSGKSCAVAGRVNVLGS